jgi:hypothetical protein
MYDTVLEHVTAFYLQSTDFNGIPLNVLQASGIDNVVKEVADLVNDGLVEVLGPSDDDNTHVKRFEMPGRERQLGAITSGDLSRTRSSTGGASH